MRRISLVVALAVLVPAVALADPPKPTADWQGNVGAGLILMTGNSKTTTFTGNAQAIRDACAIGLDNGVDFLKTSTGKTTHGASREAAQEMLGAIAAHPRGAAVGFKASGGIRTVADAAVYIHLARQRLGPGAAKPTRLRFGASALLDDIERVLAGGTAGAAPSAGY